MCFPRATAAAQTMKERRRGEEAGTKPFGLSPRKVSKNEQGDENRDEQVRVLYVQIHQFKPFLLQRLKRGTRNGCDVGNPSTNLYDVAHASGANEP
jgi:hypothetical protein